MYIFQKGNQQIEVNEGDIHWHLSVFVEKKENVWIIQVPILNLLGYTEDENDIENTLKASLKSFFNYWTKVADKAEFFDKMHDLGFNLIGELTPNDKPSARGNSRELEGVLEI